MSNELDGTFNSVFGPGKRGDKNLNFANWYDDVLILQIIGRNGCSSTTLSFFNLSVLIFP